VRRTGGRILSIVTAAARSRSSRVRSARGEGLAYHGSSAIAMRMIEVSLNRKTLPITCSVFDSADQDRDVRRVLMGHYRGRIETDAVRFEKVLLAVLWCDCARCHVK
jgi:hypothetical protein